MKYVIQISLDGICPVSTISVEESQPDWMTRQVKKHIKLKQKLLRLAKKTKAEEDWNSFREQHCITLNCIRQSKAYIVKDQLAQSDKNSRTVLGKYY